MGNLNRTDTIIREYLGHGYGNVTTHSYVHTNVFVTRLHHNVIIYVRNVLIYYCIEVVRIQSYTVMLGKGVHVYTTGCSTTPEG